MQASREADRGSKYDIVFNARCAPVFWDIEMASDVELYVVPHPGAPARAVGSAVALTSRSDEELMVASTAGRRDAFEVLVARYLPRLTSYCAKLVRDARAGEDLAQDTVLALWQGRAGYRPDRALRVLVFTIALNRCRNHARSWRRRLRWLHLADEPGAVDQAVVGDAVPVDQLLDLERQRHVRAALSQLPHHARAVLLLRFEQELSYAEIAEVVGKREVTVRSQVFHALRRLARLLDKEAA